MKKSLLLIAIVAINLFSLRAQTLTIDENYHNLVLNAIDFGDVVSYVHNNSSSTIQIKWTRFVDVQPNGWTTTVCDDINCYAPNTGAAPNAVTLTSGDDGLLKLN